MLVQDWSPTQGKPSFDFLVKADYVKVAQNVLTVDKERVFGKDAKISFGMGLLAIQ